MKLHRLLLGLLLVAALVGAAYLGQNTEPAGARMTDAATRFLNSLTPEQKAKAAFDFDDKDRTNWHFTPYQTRDKQPQRKGVRLGELNDTQKTAALDLVRAGTSASGLTKATTIMSLESILHELEKNGAMTRDPGWYFFTVYGTPAKTGKWGWRVEGHHLSLNFTLDGTKVLSATPAFFGANPAVVQAGPRKGLETLREAEEYARDLFNSLDDGQKKTAHQNKDFPEIQEAKPLPDVGEPKGLAAADMKPNQKETLLKLLDAYATRMPPDIAEREMKGVKDAGIDKVRFAFTGGTKPGEKHSYRIQGPTFVVEFLNVQSDSAGNPANHIHSSWRSLTDDFGLAAR